MLHFLQAFPPRNALIQTPKSCSRKEERGTASPGSPGSAAAPACVGSSTAEPLCSTQRFQPCLAAGKKAPCLFVSHRRSGFWGRDDVTRKAGGRAQGTFHVSWRSQSHLCVHTAPAPRQVFLSPNTAQQPPLRCAAHRAAPQGIPSAGFWGGVTLHRIGVPHTRLTRAPAAPHGTDMVSACTCCRERSPGWVQTCWGAACRGWGQPAELNLPRSRPNFIAFPPSLLLLPLGADG